MSLTANGTGCCMAPDEHIMTGHHFCNLRNQVDVICLRVSSDSNMKFRHSVSVEDKSYAVNSFHLFANVLVAFWLFLVASSYFLLRKNVNIYGGCRGKRAEKVSSSVRTISDATTENDATAADDTFSCSESFSSNNSWGELCTKWDAYYEISDFDMASYMHSLLSLEGKDSEWLSDSMPYGLSYENPSTPLSSYKCDAYHEISDFEQGSYMHSLLSLEDEDSEWLLDSKSFGCSSENPSTPLSYKCNAYFDISALEKASYMHSSLSLEDEDSEWLSDSKLFVGSISENPSTPISYKFDAASEISDFSKASYMHSLLSLEDEDSEWLSNSKYFGCSSESISTPLSYKCDASEISDLDKASYIHSLLSLEDEDSEWLSDSKLFGGSISENPSTPISYKFDASEISDFSKASYMHSLLSVDDEDSEWLSNSKSFGCSSESISTPLSYKCHASSVISDFSKASCMHSLLSLEDEDSAEWLSDSKSFGWSSENPSTPLSSKCDAFSDISDLDKASYMYPSISIEDEDSDWLSDSKSYGFSSENSTPSYKFDAYNYEISDLDKASYLHSLLILEDEDSEWLSDSSSWSIVVPPSVSTSSSFTGVNCGNSEEEFSADEPLFWPFEGKLNWNSEEPWTSFCSSPRRRFDSRSTTSRIKGCNNKQKGDEALCIVNYETSRLSMWPKSSEKIVPLVCENFYSNKDHLLLGKEYSALYQELTIEALVGLKEFDGHEGLDSEFDQVFLLDQYLQ